MIKPLLTSPSMQKVFATVLIMTLLGALVAHFGTVSRPMPLPPPSAGLDVYPLQNPAIDEASGLARAQNGRAQLWVINDSGNPAQLFRIDYSGQGHASVRIDGASNVDWEDLANFRRADAPYLLIADVGDNRARRESVTLYWLPEPGSGSPRAEVTGSLQLRYPDGPRDCEAVAVDASGQYVYLLSKRDQPPRLYRVALPRTDGHFRGQAEYLGLVDSLPSPTPQDRRDDPRYGGLRSQPTALDAFSDGSGVVVLTYKDAYLYRLRPGQPWIDALGQTPRALGLPQFSQAEAGVASDDSYFAASEQLPAALVRLKLPSIR